MPSRQVPVLSRRDVTDAAIGLIERDGLGALTMRRLAAELGCAPMSLYTHVRSRDDLVDAIVDRLIEQLDLHEVPAETWDSAVRRTLGSYRDLAVRSPAAFELLALAPYDTSPVAPHLANVLTGLEHAGLDAEQARQILGIVDAYASGFLVVWARSRARAAQGADGRGDDGQDAGIASMRHLDMFDEGLDALIAGLDATLVRHA
ncbi:TetR/AcrR family transcriptional regulator [Microbacterium mangrovi]|uniref:TetR/AcrR family transcriptional regulator n=1 Tax=Microbacterium mangrovi TaxID=1348253 RepID=UPI000A57DC3F|nr:TetR/AcrR family transcriptional regulator [Microbacterium mangrovi]